MRTNKILPIIILSLFALLLTTPGVLAADDNIDSVQDVDELINDKIFDSDGDGSGDNLTAARMVLVVGLMIGTIVPLAVLHADLPVIVIMAIGVLGLCVAIGWLSEIFLLLIALVIAALWGDKITKIITGGSGNGSSKPADDQT